MERLGGAARLSRQSLCSGIPFPALDHIQLPWKLNVVQLLYVVSFSDEKPVPTPDQVRGRLFLKMLD